MTGRELITLLLKYDLDAQVHFEVPFDYVPSINEEDADDELLNVNDVYEIPPDDVIPEPWIVLTVHPLVEDSLFTPNLN